MSEENNIGKAMEWNDTIEDDGADFVILPEGEYNFEVKSWARANFRGSAKMSSCPMAIINIEVFNADVSTTIMHNLYLNTKTERMICEFFRSCGLLKHGDKSVMPWNKIVGCKGRCKVIQKELESTKNPGQKFLVNNIKKFLDPEF